MTSSETENGVTLFHFVGILAGLLLLSACGGGDADDPDPTVNEQPIAYVKRTTPIDNNNNLIENDLRDPVAFRPGAHLIVKNVPSLDSAELDVTAALIGDTGDVRDPEFNHDGTKLLFSLHMEDDNNDPDINWDIYEYDLTRPLSQNPGSENPRRVMFVDNDIQGHDIAPAYMPPGDRIVFSSTRAARTGSISLAEGNGAFSPTIEATNSNTLALNLHTMGTDGQNIRQITFNMSHDLDPSIVRNIPGYAGHIMFSRWENAEGRNQMSLYVIKPDGTEVTHLYGAHSHATGTGGSNIQFSHPRENSNGDVVVVARDFNNTQDGGDPMIINVSGYLDNTVPKNSNPGGTGPAQRSVTGGAIVTNGGFSQAGRYGSVIPLLDGTNRAIASYSFCIADIINPTTMLVEETRFCSDPVVNLADPNTVPAPPRYGIYVLNMGNNTISPVTIAQPNTYYTDVAVAHDFLDEGQFIDDSYNINDPTIGTIHIRSVYDMDGSFNPMGSTATSLAELSDPAQFSGDPATGLPVRPAMFLRIVKGTYLPDNDVRDFDTAAFGPGGSSQLMRQIIGYVPIDPDGSARFNVPSDIPISFDVLDRNGRRVNGMPRHGNWITVRPGETVTCHGCHNHGSGNPHGNLAAQLASINPGAPVTLVWPNTDSNNVPLVNVGDTMAFARTENQGNQSLTPSVNINYDDPWTDPVATGRAVDTPFSYSYTTVQTTHPLNQGGCVNNWDESCRIIVNYEAHVQPIFEFPRVDSGMVGRQCISCHTTYDAVGAQIQVPAGKYQLDLTRNSPDATGMNSVDTQDPDYVKSYIELVQDDNILELMGATLVDEQFPAGSGVTMSVFNGTGLNSLITRGSASNSNAFFEVFTEAYYNTYNGVAGRMPHWDPNGGGVGIGAPWLTSGELKLISEWIDIGGQYYNSPFDAPIN